MTFVGKKTLIVLFGLFVFYSCLLAILQKPFSDDWMILEIGRELHGKSLLEWLTVKDSFNVWRPLAYDLKGLYLAGGVKSLEPYNAFKVVLFLLTGGVTYCFGVYATGRRTVGLLAALLFFCNPTIVGTLQNIDHIFKITGTLFYLLVVGLFWLYLETRKTTYCIAAFVLFATAFYSDADALAIMPAFCLLLLAYVKKIDYKRILALVFTAVLVVGIYLYLRNLVVGGALSGGVSGKQDILLNYNMLLNAAKISISCFIFTMSPYLFLKKKLYVVAGGLFLAGNLGIIVSAIIRVGAEERKKLFVLLGLAVTATVPFILIRHVSEIYTFRTATLFMVVLGYAIVLIFDNAKPIIQKLLIGFVSLMLVSGVFSVIMKQKMMLERGLMAERMAAAMMDALPAPAPNSTILLDIGACGPEKTYSDFINDDSQLAGITRYFVRYAYEDASLNPHGDTAVPTYILQWDCLSKKFSLTKGVK